MANAWIDVYGFRSATTGDMPTAMVNYDTNGSGNISGYSANNSFTIPTGTTFQEMYNINGLKISGYVTSDGSGIGFKIELNGKHSENTRSAGAGTYQSTCSIGVLYNESNYGKIVIFIPNYFGGNPGYMGLGYYPDRMKTDLYNWIVNNPYITHIWESVGSISGKLGTFNLSTIKDTDINNGDPVSNATSSAFNVLQQTTKLSVLVENKSELTPVIYTDNINYLSLKDLTNNKCELKFYLHDRSFLKITNVSTNAFLSILIDEENKVAKPSIIYKNGSSYSYNQEEPSADTMKHLYEWLMVNEQNIKKKTGLWKTSFAFERLDD